MNHGEAAERLWEYRDGELGQAERRGVEAHLASCAACRAELARWERAAAALFAPAPSSEAFVASVMRRIEESERDAASAPVGLLARLLGPRLALSAAAGIAALVLAYHWIGARPEPAPKQGGPLAYAEQLILEEVGAETENGWGGYDLEEYFL